MDKKPVKKLGRPFDESTIEDRWWCYQLYVVDGWSGGKVADELSMPRTTVVKWALEIARALGPEVVAA